MTQPSSGIFALVVTFLFVTNIEKGFGDTFGTITCSSPEVFTRSRLVDARFRETQWLQDQLKTIDSQGLQGGTEFQSQSDLRASLQATMDPLMAAQLRQQVQTPPTNALGAVTPPNLPGSVAPTNLIDPSTLALVNDKIKEMPTDTIKDKMAARDYIEELMTEKQLDDTHDLKGSTLYTLKFDIGVHPGNDTKAYAMVFVTASTTDDGTGDKIQIDDWVHKYLQFQISSLAQMWTGRLFSNASNGVIARMVETFADRGLTELSDSMKSANSSPNDETPFGSFVHHVYGGIDGLTPIDQEEFLERQFPSLAEFAQVFNTSNPTARLAAAFKAKLSVVTALTTGYTSGDTTKINLSPDAPIIELLKAHNLIVKASATGTQSPPPPAAVTGQSPASVSPTSDTLMNSPGATASTTVAPDSEFDESDLYAVLTVALNHEIIEIRATLRKYDEIADQQSEPQGLQTVMDALLKDDQAKIADADNQATLNSNIKTAGKDQVTEITKQITKIDSQLQAESAKWFASTAQITDLGVQKGRLENQLQTQKAVVAAPTPDQNTPPGAPAVKKATSPSQDRANEQAYFDKHLLSRLAYGIMLSTYTYKQESLTDYVHVNYLQNTNYSEEGFFTPILTSGDQNTFDKAVKDAEREKIRVCEVEPTELAENISSMASREQSFALDLAFAGRLTSGVTLGAASDYIHKTLQMSQAIDRHPLIVSFTESASQFGWILGPSFEINEDNNPDFSQQMTSHPVSVSLAVPGWLGHIYLKGWYVWLNEDGKILAPAHPLWTKSVLIKNDDTDPRPTTKGLFSWFQHKKDDLPTTTDLKSLPVGLAPDLESLTYALALNNTMADRMPILIPAPQTLQGGGVSNQTILIEGTEVWRNPSVFVGSVRADHIDILPDMQSLAAHFTNPITLAPGNYPVTVITSVGRDTLPGDVTVQSPASAPAVNPVVSVTETRIKPSGTITFTYPPDQWPKAYSSITVKLTPTGGTIVNPTLNPETEPGKRTATLGTMDTYKDPIICKLDMALQASSDGTQTTSLLAGGPKVVVLYPGDTDKFKWDSAATQTLKLSTDPISFAVILNNPDATPDWPTFMKNFSAGYPQLNGFASPALKLRITSDKLSAPVILDLQPTISSGLQKPGGWTAGVKAQITAAALGLPSGTHVFSANVIANDSSDYIPVYGTISVTVP